MVYALERRASISGWEFFLRRLARIGPPYWIITFWALLLNAFAPFFFFGPADPLLALKSALFLPTTRMGPDDLVPLVQPGWTLNLEMLFYTLIAIGLAWTGRAYGIFAAVGLVAVFTIANAFQDAALVWRMYAVDVGIILEFIFGMFIGYYHFYSAENEKRFFGLFLVAAGFVLLAIGWHPTSPDYRLINAGAPALIIVAGVVFSEPLWRDNALSRRLVVLGNASYSIYLTHLFFIIPTLRALGRSGYVNSPLAHPALTFFIFFAGCLILGLVFYLLIEKPAVKAAQKAFLRFGVGKALEKSS